MTVKKRQMIERLIASTLIRAGLKAGYAISVNNGGEGDEISPSTDRKAILAAMFATDDEHLRFHRDGKYAGWVYFVYGNYGYDAICDYTLSLEPLMEGANRVSDRFS